MLVSLIKKEFLIVKKYVLLMLVVSVLIPLFMLWRVPVYAGVMGYVLMVIFAIFMLTQYVSQKECQYPKASALFCAAPYPRRLMVLSKYCFCLIIYAACCLIFGIETLIFPELGAFSVKLAVDTLMAVSVFLGIYFPLQYWLGYEKTKFAFVIVIMASPFLLPQLLKMGESVNPGLLRAFPNELICSGMSLIVLIISACISVRVYNKADLA